MPINVSIPTPLRKYTAGAERVQCAAANLRELFEALEQKYPGIRQAISAADGTPLKFINIYVNDEDIRFLGGATCAFREGDEILLVPAVAGGA